MRCLPLVPLLIALIAPDVRACIWDSDTIASEKARFPGVEEVMFGNFPRHSKEFHEWRKKRSEALIAADPRNLAAYDDLAVSQHKLGDHEGAIATMKRKDAVKPGLYETFSNTGTFYIYTNNFAAALGQIEKALEINPNAHFGREKYQKWLIEWVMEGMPGEGEESSEMGPGIVGFATWITRKQDSDKDQKKLTEPQRKEAIHAVLGMMRFADFDNPLLQEALGDLLLSGSMDKNASRHAAMAYLHAHSRADGADAKARLSKKFDLAAETVEDGDPKKFAKRMNDGLAKGNAFAGRVRKYEMAWIAENKDVSAEFAESYLNP